MLRRTLSRFAKLLGTSACPPVCTGARASRFRPTVEALEAREVPAVFFWTGAQSTDATNPFNWSVGTQVGSAPGVPGEGDVLHFSSTLSTPIPGQPSLPPISTPSCDGLISYGNGTSFAAVYIESTYTSTVTMGEALTFGTFELAGGAISQSAAAHALTVNGSFTWTGGVLNSTPSVANVNLFGGGLFVLPTGGALTTGSVLNFSCHGPESITTITGDGNLVLNGVLSRALNVSDGAKVIRAMTGEVRKGQNTNDLILIINQGEWGYVGSGSRTEEFRVINNSCRFHLYGKVDVELKGERTEFGYSQTSNSTAKLEIQAGTVLKSARTFGIDINGGIVWLTGNTNLGVNAQYSTIIEDLTISGGTIGFLTPVQIGQTKVWNAFVVAGTVSWSGGEFQPGINCGPESQLEANCWVATKFIIDTASTNKPRIAPVPQFLPQDQIIPAESPWLVLASADGITGKPTTTNGWDIELLNGNARIVKS